MFRLMALFGLHTQAAHTSDLRKSLQLGIRAIELAEAQLAADGASPQDLRSYDEIVSALQGCDLRGCSNARQRCWHSGRELGGGDAATRQVLDITGAAC